MERAPIVFLKDRFKGPQSTINPKLGQNIDQVARKLGTIARKIKNQVCLVLSSKFWKTAQVAITHHTPRGCGKMVSSHAL